jgi:hypothetical protein
MFMVNNDLLRKILDLSPEDREHVQNVISTSLSDGYPPQLSPAEVGMLLERIEKYDKNPDALIPWSTVKSRLAEQRAKN